MCGDVLQVALAAANELEQTAACGEVLLVYLEVLGKLLDALSFNTNLHGCATGVGFVALQVFYDCLFFLTCNHTTTILTDEPQKDNTSLYVIYKYVVGHDGSMPLVGSGSAD